MARTKSFARKFMVPAKQPAKKVLPKPTKGGIQATFRQLSAKPAHKKKEEPHAVPVKPIKDKQLKKIKHHEPSRRKRRARQGTVALHEMRLYQRTTELLLPKKPFQRVVREILEDLNKAGTGQLHIERVQPEALMALQEGAEAYVVEQMDHAQHAAIHARRITIMPKDLRLARRIHGIGSL